MQANEAQAEYWDAQSSWVANQVAMDTLLSPVLDLVLERAALRPGEHVLDIGCGTGTSVLKAAKAVGRNGRVLGVDISHTLLDLARARSDEDTVAFRHADAQIEPFEPAFDIVMSRFGVMFFEDTAAAFANIRTALKPNGRFALATWGPAPENPYFMLAAKAVRHTLGEMPKVDRTLPGPFALEDAARTQQMLEAGGVSDVRIEPVSCALTPGGSVEDLAELCLAIGPAASGLHHFEADAADRASLKAALVRNFTPFVGPDGIKIPALINMITARI